MLRFKFETATIINIVDKLLFVVIDKGAGKGKAWPSFAFESGLAFGGGIGKMASGQ